MTSSANAPASVLRLLAFSAFALAGLSPADETPEPRKNLLGWAEGAFTVRTPSPARTTAHVIALDGFPDTRPVGVPRHAPLPHEFVIELPAVTRFDTFAVPELGEFGPAKGKHVKTVEIQGSGEGPEKGFTPLVTFEIAVGKGAPQEFKVPEIRPVRWLKVRFLDRATPQANDTDSVLFSELMGYGTQEGREPAGKGFNGIWSLRRGYDVSPNLIELRQEGGLVSGCQVLGGQHGKISGTVENGIARLVATTTQGTRVSSVPMMALITVEGELHGVQSLHSGLAPFSGVPSKPGARTPCSEEPAPENPVGAALEAGLSAVIYGIHFDVDSDVLRPDAEPALKQVLAALEERPDIAVTIEGHTDSDGGDDHNLDLSKRRSEAVVKWLAARGISTDRLQAAGKGETEPIADNKSAVGRQMNRRVEAVPR